MLAERDSTEATVALGPEGATAATNRIMPTAREVLREALPERPRMPSARELPDGRREYEFKLSPRAAVAMLGALVLAVIVLALAAGGDDGGRTPGTPPDAPLERQLEELERDVRSLK